jgi:hypothetical protein
LQFIDQVSALPSRKCSNIPNFAGKRVERAWAPNANSSKLDSGIRQGAQHRGNAFHCLLKALLGLSGTLTLFHDPAVFPNRSDGEFCSTNINRTDCFHVNFLTQREKHLICR